ncbi:MAG: endopeptidase La [Bacilli bacterium]|nr:endopeptidase La [Bacilli bacterium]
MVEKGDKITLPVLITRGLIVFPYNPCSIEAARDFSMRAIEASRKETDSLILIVVQKNPATDKPTKNDVYDVGSLCRIQAFVDQKKFYRIKVNCTRRVKILDLQESNGMYVASAEPLDDIRGDNKEEMVLVRDMLNEIQRSPELRMAIPPQLIPTLSKPMDAIEFANILASTLPMPTEKRQELLATDNINERLMKIYKLINKEKEIASIDQKIQKEVRDSMDKSQKDYILREKLKQIHKELGDNEEGDQSLLDKLEKNPYPEHIKKKVKSEYKRYEMMPQASLESSLIKQYIDTLMEIPWYQKTNDNDDLKNAQKILDEDHYGLTKVKERIIEYLAVKKMTGNLKAPILCFYGAPGVGKTSLGKSIARALGRKFFKASLGGISDEAEIRGHRRTYVGSMPGRIIAGMKRCGVRNPVFLLDEVDKISQTFKGDPASALLEVLDPEQNFAFNDNYVEEPYDLSDVLFIATANYIENVPAPLRDRLEIIELNSYTELEKIQIAKHFLVKKELKANGMKENQVEFKDDAIKYIINHYTMEAGVRNLERNIAKIIRKIIVELFTTGNKKKTTKKVVEIKDVQKYLGVERFQVNQKEKKNQIGVITGLAYTEYGGSTLPIEVNYFPGKGSLVLTGKLGDVMKESASIALDYVKANAKRYKIDFKLFKENDIHIHFPEGAIPKDGPSAGIAITLAIISCFSNTPASCDVAMTGEVNLRGSALPIGGLREKSLAALRSGIKKIIVPRENKRDVAELPKEVKDNLEIILMDNVDDAMKVALLKK